MSGYTIPLTINGTTRRNLIVHVNLSSGKQVSQKVVALLLRELKTCLEDNSNITQNHAKATVMSFLWCCGEMCDNNSICNTWLDFSCLSASSVDELLVRSQIAKWGRSGIEVEHRVKGDIFILRLSNTMKATVWSSLSLFFFLRYKLVGVHALTHQA